MITFRQLTSILLLYFVFDFTEFGVANAQTCSKITTYNAGLLPRIDQYQWRRSVIPAALLMQDTDVICLQEYWFEKDVVDLIKTVSVKYKYHYSKLHSSVGVLSREGRKKHLVPKTPCTLYDKAHFALNILPCVIMKGCIGGSTFNLEKILACGTSQCAPAIKHAPFSEDCFSCMTQTATSLDNLFGACYQTFDSYNNRLNGAGLVMLSRKEILRANYTDFFPRRMTIQRGFIDAEIKDVGTVVCTHLSSVFGNYFEYDLPFKSYKAQQAAEAGVLEARFGSTDHILAGDFNTGPVVNDSHTPEGVLGGEAPGNFQGFLDSGYKTAYLDDDGRCTWCRENPLTSGKTNDVIDFVMYKGESYNSTSSWRILNRSPPLSDHYGVTATVCRSSVWP